MSKILIVEDEVAIADLEKDYLELSGFDVEVANDGLIGYQKAMEEDYNLVILDLMLPGMDGFETVSYTHLGTGIGRAQRRQHPHSDAWRYSVAESWQFCGNCAV